MGQYGNNGWKVRLLNAAVVVIILAVVGGVGYGAYRLIKPQYEARQAAKAEQEKLEAEQKQLELQASADKAETERLQAEKELEEAQKEAAEAEKSTTAATTSQKSSTTSSSGSSSSSSSSSGSSSSSNSSSSSDYIFPNSNSEYLTSSQISSLSDYELRIAINEIYARRGRRFKDSSLQAYFDSKSWYNGTIDPDDFSESVFNTYESTNKDKLAAERDSR